jgi:hypothetical protein
MAQVKMDYQVALRFFKLRKIDAYFSTKTNLTYETDIEQTEEDFQRQVKRFKELLDSKQIAMVRTLKDSCIYPIEY